MYYSRRVGIVLWFAVLVGLALTSGASGEEWERQEVDWRVTGGSRIKAIRYRQGQSPPRLTSRDARGVQPRKRTIRPERLAALAPVEMIGTTNGAAVTTISIDSPPVGGFVPWVVVLGTDSRSGLFDTDAVKRSSITGDFLTSSPETDYAIGIFDTGAAIHLMGHGSGVQAGLFDAGLATSSTIEISGVNDSVDVWLSQPLGIFADSLAVLEPNALLLDTSSMKGVSNVSIGLGMGGEPDLPTVVGMPMATYFTTVIRNEQPVTVIRDSNSITGPDVRFYDHGDSAIPTYANTIPLELRSTNILSIQYFPCVEGIFFCPDGDGAPFLFPSLIVDNFLGLPLQSLYFVSSVSLGDEGNSANDKDGFMLDSGAQITVVGSGIGALLGFNPNDPDFEVEIVGVTGVVTMEAGFYIDSLTIPALGEWLSFSNVPVVLLDVASPEGGFLEGIIGMNLFTEFNLVLRGGGMPGQGAPSLKFALVPKIIGDIAPPGGDGKVDLLDLIALALAWSSNPTSANWNPDADIAPVGSPDGLVNNLDFTVLSEHWHEGVDP